MGERLGPQCLVHLFRSHKRLTALVWAQGTWNGMTPRDGALFKRLGAILRFVGGHRYGGSAQASAPSSRELLRSALWKPYAPLVQAQNGPAFASTFPSERTVDGSPEEVFLAVAGFGSKTNSSWTEAWLTLDASLREHQLFDLYRGIELKVPEGSGSLNLSFVLEASLESEAGKFGASGFGALLLTKDASDPSLLAFLAKMKQLTRKPLGAFTCEGGPQCHGGAKAWPFYSQCNESHCAGLTQTMEEIAPTRKYSRTPTIADEGMVSVPGGSFLFESYGVEWRPPPDRGNLAGQRGVGLQFPWQKSPTIPHSHQLNVSSLWVQKFPVTNNQYAHYLTLSHYEPADTEHWLEHWHPARSGRPTMPPAVGDQPVTYVSLLDAREFCIHFGLRLPHAWEWQWFAGGSARDGRLYPWGSEAPSNDTCPPVAGGVGANLSSAGPANVSGRPAGCSPAGVCDLIGNAWEMTDTFVDQHNRAVLLKGGSHYYAKGSMWYFGNALKLAQHQKAFLFSDGYERAATVGFRCVADSSIPGNFTPAPVVPPKPNALTGCGANCTLCERGTAPCACLNFTGKCAVTRAAPESLDLSHVGASDWVATSIHGSAAVSRMGKPTAEPLAFSLVKATANDLVPYCCSPLSLAWSDGQTPHAAKAAASGDGVYSKARGSGFSVRASAADGRLLTLFAGCWKAECKLTVQLEGGSAQTMDIKTGGEVIMYRFEVFVRGAVVVTWELVEGGNITFQAAVLGAAGGAGRE